MAEELYRSAPEVSSRLKEVDYRFSVYLIALRFCLSFLPSLILRSPLTLTLRLSSDIAFSP